MYKAAIDLGTTTIAVSLLDEEGKHVFQDGFLNPQKRYGSDVITRITLSERPGNLENMTGLVRESILSSLRKLLHKALSIDEAKEIPISGYLEKVVLLANTCMASIFLGLPVGSLGTYPFRMPFQTTERIELEGVPFYVLAGASAFLGADSVAGAYSLHLGDGDVLLDMGTNGEILLCRGEQIYGASAACGPAFENCTRPMGVQANTTLKVISDLISRRKIRRDGILTEDFILNGLDYSDAGVHFHLTEDIFRSVQLATSALYTTYQLLMQEAGIQESDIKHYYLAGGFMFYVRLYDAMNIGLIPERMMERAVVAGNTSLLAAEHLAVAEQADSVIAEYEAFCDRVRTCNFGGDSRYEALFAENLILKRR